MMNPKFYEIGCKLLCLCLSVVAAIVSFSAIIFIPSGSALDLVSFVLGVANTVMACWMAIQVAKAWRGR